MAEESCDWLIRKGSYFYRPNCQGYTTSKAEAGRYTKSEADREVAVEPWHMKAIHETDWPDDPVSSDITRRIATLQSTLADRTKERDDWRASATELADLVTEWEVLTEAAEARLAEAVKVIGSVEEWWLREGMHEPGRTGAPYAMFAVRAFLDPASRFTDGERGE